MLKGPDVDEQPTTKTVKPGELIDVYTVVKSQAESFVKFGEDGMADTPLLHVDIQLEMYRSRVRLALHKVYSHYSKMLAGVEVMTKPKVLVRTTRPFAAGDLILAPISTNVVHTSQKVPPSAVDMGINFTDAKVTTYKFYIPSNVDLHGKNGKSKFIVPFFLVKKAADTAVVNMKLSHVECNIAVNVPHKQIESDVVNVPVLTNSVDLDAGAELKVHEKA